MRKIQKVFIEIILFIVIAGLIASIGLGIQGATVASGASERTTSMTSMTSEDQKAIEAKILEDWGTPTELKILRSIKETQMNNDLSQATDGNLWYYLTQDIDAELTTILTLNQTNPMHVRILLNGYSISGNFKIQTNNAAVTLSIFDKIPDKIGTGYNYNPLPIKYYKYNVQQNEYTDYTITRPRDMTDVSSMPTWKENTYIKVTGSAISPNEKINNTSVQSLIAAQNGTINIYGTNFVGCTADSSLISASNGNVNLYQSILIGNKSKDGSGVIKIGSAITTLKDCNVYGNQSEAVDYGIQPSGTDIPEEEWDIVLTNGNSTINMYKSNVGAIADANYTKAIYIKDVDFGQQEASVKSDNITTFFESFNDVFGTIELVYNGTVTYTGNSSNLNFIVHGGDKNTVPKRGSNSLTIAEGATVGSVSTAFETAEDGTLKISDVTINGTVLGLSTPGNAKIGANANATIKARQNVANLTNQGNLNVFGTVSNLETTGTLSINSTATIENLTLNDGYVLIYKSANVKNVNLNNGTLEIADNANVDTITKSDVARLIDHRGTFKTFIIWASAIFGGVVVIALIVLLIIFIVKRKKDKCAKSY